MGRPWKQEILANAFPATARTSSHRPLRDTLPRQARESVMSGIRTWVVVVIVGSSVAVGCESGESGGAGGTGGAPNGDCPGRPASPTNGSADESCIDGALDDTCSFACEAEYVSFDSEITCTSGGWSEAVCVPLYDLDEDGLRRFPWGPDFDDDGDGALQLAVGGNDHADDDPSRTGTTGDGTFTVGDTYDLGASAAPTGIATADFDNDGDLDLVTTNQNNDTVSVLLGNGDGTFTPTTPIALTGGGSVSVGDFNEDGYVDIFAARSLILINDGDATFTEADSISVGDTVSTHVADLNGDGHLDIVGARYSTSIIAVLGNGDGTFDAPVETNQPETSAIAIGYLDADGVLDVAVTTFASTVSTFVGDGDGTFTFGMQQSTSYVGPVAVGDLDGDGNTDVIAGNAIGTDINIMLGTGLGGIGAPVTVDIESGSIDEILVADINGDGDQDLALVSQSAGFAYAIGDGAGNVGGFSYRNLGDGEFGLAAGFFDEGSTLDFAVACIDSDDTVIVLGD